MDTVLKEPAERSGTFDGGKVSIAQDGDNATITLVLENTGKQQSPDVTLTIYEEDTKGNKTLLTSGSVTPGPWIDKNGKAQDFGSDPAFGLSGVKGKTLSVEATLSKPVTCSVTTDAKVQGGQ